MSSLLKHGADPNQLFRSPISRDSLNRALAIQGRRPGKRPLVNWKLVLEMITSNLRTRNKGVTVHNEYAELQPPYYMHSDRQNTCEVNGPY